MHILNNFLQIFAYLTTITSKLSYKTKVEIVHITQVINEWVEQSSFWFYRIILMLWWSNRQNLQKIAENAVKVRFGGQDDVIGPKW